MFNQDPMRQALMGQMRGPAMAQQAPRTPPVLPPQANPNALEAVQRAYSQPRPQMPPQQMSSPNGLGSMGNSFGVRPTMPTQPMQQAPGMDQRSALLALMRGGQ
jgi:hypothetical protein